MTASTAAPARATRCEARECARSGIRHGSPSRLRSFPDSKLIDAPPHRLSFADIAPYARQYELLVLHTSSPSFPSDVKTAEAIKALNPDLKIGFIGAKVAVEPDESFQGVDAPSTSSPATSSTSPSRRSPTDATGQDRRPLLSQSPTASSSTTPIARSSKTWTRCRS